MHRSISPALTWALSLVVTTVLAAYSFQHIDVPMALRILEAGRFLQRLSGAFGATVILTVEAVVILAISLARLVRGSVSRFGQTLAIASLTSICSYGINDAVLKVCFGVPDPYDVMHGARHAFHFFMGSEGSSFPSGHMVLAGAFAGVFMTLYRVSIWPLTTLLLLAAALLLAGGWHFLSDVIVGAFLGISAGILAGAMQSGRAPPTGASVAQTRRQ